MFIWFIHPNSNPNVYDFLFVKSNTKEDMLKFLSFFLHILDAAIANLVAKYFSG